MKRSLKPPPAPSKRVKLVGPTKKTAPAPQAFSLQALASKYGSEQQRDVEDDEQVVTPDAQKQPTPKKPTQKDATPKKERTPKKQKDTQDAKVQTQSWADIVDDVRPPAAYDDDIISGIARLVKMYHSRSHVELEAKLGQWSESGFVSGVSEPSFCAFLGMLESYHGWEKPVWKYSHDYVLKNQVRCTHTSAGNAFVRKSLIEHLTLRCENRAYDIRFSLKEEVPTEVRTPGEPILIRVKKRKSFVYKDKLQFDLTVVWTGTTEQEAHYSKPTFEVELECINKSLLGLDHMYTATSMVEKMLDFIGRESTTSMRML